MGLATRGTLSRSRVVQRVAVHNGKIVCVAWSRAGAYLAAACQDGVIFIFEVPADGGGIIDINPVRVLVGHVGDILAMAWSANDFLATASTDHSVCLWHPHTDVCLRRFFHPDMVTAVAFHPTDDNCLATGGCDGVARLWRPAAHTVAAESAADAAISAMRFSVDGDALHVGRYNGSLVEHDVKHVVGGVQDDAILEPMLHGAVTHADGGQTVLLSANVKRCVAPARRRMRAGGAKVCAIAQSCGDLVAVTADGRAHVFGPRDSQCVVRLKGSGKRGGGEVQRSLTADGRFLVGDVDGGEVHVVDFARSRASGGGLRRLVRDSSLSLESVVVMKNGNVSAAEFASEKVVEYVLGESCVKGAVVLAVGGDDGVLHIVTNVLRDRT